MTPVTFLRHVRQSRKVRHHLRRCFPAAFPPRGAPPLPLAIGVHHLINLAVMGTFDPAEVRRCLRRYTGRPDYLHALRDGVHRVHLDGSPAGEITPEDRAHAADRLLPAGFAAANRKAAA